MAIGPFAASVYSVLSEMTGEIGRLMNRGEYDHF